MKEKRRNKMNGDIETAAFILGFAIFFATYMACDTFLFSKGYSSIFHEAKTKIEKTIQKKLLDNG